MIPRPFIRAMALPILTVFVLLTACTPSVPSDETSPPGNQTTATEPLAGSLPSTSYSGESSAADTTKISDTTTRSESAKGETPSMTTKGTQTTTRNTTPARTPERVGTMTMHNLFYKAAPSGETVDCVDLRGEDNATVIAALCLQGLIARSRSASVFVITCTNDEAWKNDLTRRYHVTFRSTTADELFYRYRDLVKKRIIYGFPGGDNYEMVMAINIASVSDGLPVTEALDKRLTALSTVPREDVRGRWNGRVSAYTWGIEHILPQCTRHYVGACDQNDTVWDYLYATKSFCFWLDYTFAPEREVIEQLLRSDYTMPGLVFGYGEGGDLLLNATAPEGFAYFVSDYFVNATFFSSFSASKAYYTQNPIMTAGQTPQNGVMYVSLYISDGDNVQFNQKASQFLWSNTAHRGAYPIGLELNPALYELAPTMLEWYISRLTKNDELMGGPAGFSYIWEDIYKPSAFSAWHAVNNYFLQKAGMRTIASSRVPQVNDRVHFMSQSVILGALDWGDPSEADQSFSGNAYLFEDKPLVVSTNCGLDITDKFSSVEPDPDRPTFYSLCITQAALGEAPGGMYYGYRYINEQCDKLKARYGENIRFCLPSDLLTLAHTYLKQ